MKVMALFIPTTGESKLAVLSGPATSVTFAGAPFNPDRLAIVVPSKVLSVLAANTNMRCVRVAPPVSVNLGR